MVFCGMYFALSFYWLWLHAPVRICLLPTWCRIDKGKGRGGFCYDIVMCTFLPGKCMCMQVYNCLYMFYSYMHCGKCVCQYTWASLTQLFVQILVLIVSFMSKIYIKLH